MLSGGVKEPWDVSDRSGFLKIVYREPGFVVVQQASPDFVCLDDVLGTPLNVPSTKNRNEPAPSECSYTSRPLAWLLAWELATMPFSCHLGQL